MINPTIERTTTSVTQTEGEPIITQTPITPSVTTTTTSTPVIETRETSSDTIWIVVITIILTAFVVGSLSFVYFQSAITQMRNDNEIIQEKLRNQINSQQLQEQIKEDVKEEIKLETPTSPNP